MEPASSPEQQLRPVRIPPLTMHIVRFVILMGMVAFAIHLLLPQISGLEQSWAVVQSMPLSLVALAALAQVGNYGGTGLMMQSLARLLDDNLSIVRGTLIAVAAPSVGMVAGGTVGNSAITYRWVRGSGVHRLAAALCATIPLMLIHLMLLLVSIVGLVTLFFSGQLTAVEVFSFALVLAILCVIAFGALFGMRRPASLKAKLTPMMVKYNGWRNRPFDPTVVDDYVNQLVDCGVVLRTGWHGPMVGAVLNLGFDMFTLYVLFLAAGYQLPISMLLAGYGLPLLVGRLPIVPGGVGLVEASMTAIFVGLGAPHGPTVVATLGYRLFSFWIPTFLGYAVALYLQRATRPPDEDPGGGAGQAVAPASLPVKSAAD